MKYFSQASSVSSAIYREIGILYDLASGKLSESDYSYVLYPLGDRQKNNPNMQGYPAKIRNYDIISNIVELFIGEYINRDKNPVVSAVNSDVDAIKEEAKLSLVKQSIIADFQQELLAQGMDPEVMHQKLSMSEITEKVESIPDLASRTGQDALEYLIQLLSIDRKLRLAFFDWIVTDRVFTYRDLFGENIEYRTVHPRDIHYNADPNEDFIEDGESVYVTYRISPSEFLDKFSDEISEKDLYKYLSKTGTTGHSDTYVGMSDVFSRYSPDHIFGGLSEAPNSSDYITIKHVVWRSFRKIGWYTQRDPFGNVIDKIKVDEDFKPLPHEEVEWEWEDEIWEGFEYGQDGKYLGIKPIPHLKGKGVKLPYNGRVYNNRKDGINSIVSKGKPYQELYNIIKYQLEKTLAKNKSDLTVLPMGLIAEDKGYDVFTTMYYADASGYLFVDDSNPRALQALQAVRAIGANLNNYIKTVYDICNEIKMEYEESVGIIPQRKGQTNSSDKVGVTERAVFQSSVISEHMFTSFEEYEERDFQQLLQLSKFAWSDGKRVYYHDSEGRKKLLDILPKDFLYTDLSVFVQKGRKSHDKLNEFKKYAQSFAQNGASPSVVGKIIQSSNIEKVMKELSDMEAEMDKRRQTAQQAEQEIEQQKAQQEQQVHQDNLNLEYYKTDKEALAKENVALIQQQTNILNMLENGKPASDVDIDSMLDSINKERAELSVKQQELETKLKVSENQLKIAKENKNKYDV